MDCVDVGLREIRHGLRRVDQRADDAEFETLDCGGQWGFQFDACVDNTWEFSDPLANALTRLLMLPNAVNAPDASIYLISRRID